MATGKKGEHVCVICGKTYLGYTTSNVCSTECRKARDHRDYVKYRQKQGHEAGYQMKPCTECGKEFYGNHRQRYCCKECKAISNRRMEKESRRKATLAKQMRQCSKADRLNEAVKAAENAGMTYGQWSALHYKPVAHTCGNCKYKYASCRCVRSEWYNQADTMHCQEWRLRA